jgi:hypothetical protein
MAASAAIFLLLYRRFPIHAVCRWKADEAFNRKTWMSPEELAALDNFRFKHRMPTRAAAVRELLKFGLTAIGIDGATGLKSSDYGVFSRGPNGHKLDEPPEAE